MKNNKILHITTAHQNNDNRIFQKQVSSLKLQDQINKNRQQQICYSRGKKDTHPGPLYGEKRRFSRGRGAR